MPSPVADTYAIPSGARLDAGRPRPGGDATAPDFFLGEVGLYGLNPSSYLLGWPHAYDSVGVTAYEYSLDGGSTWTSTGTAVHAYITGRTASATDQVRVRAKDAAGNISSVLSRAVTLPAVGAVPTMMYVVGAGGDYATPQAAQDALPASFVSANQCWELLLLNQEWVDNTGNVLFDINGKGTDATHTLRVTAFPGHSFADHPNRRTNPLRYNPAVGASLKAFRNSTENPTVDIRFGFVKFERLQVLSTPGAGTGYGGGWGVHTSSPTQPVHMDQCIVESSHHFFVESFNYGPSAQYPHIISRCVIISNRPVGGPAMDRIGESAQDHIRHYNCLFIAVGRRARAATAAKQPTITFESCGFFGVDYAMVLEGVNIIAPGPTFTNCFSDATNPLPAGVTYMATTAAKFVSITAGSHDLRLQSDSPLIGAGVVNATYSSRDITGKSRAASNDVGPWQA